MKTIDRILKTTREINAKIDAVIAEHKKKYGHLENTYICKICDEPTALTNNEMWFYAEIEYKVEVKYDWIKYLYDKEDKINYWVCNDCIPNEVKWIVDKRKAFKGAN